MREKSDAPGRRVVVAGDAGYPSGLADLADPPQRLFVAGVLSDGGTAVIGTRRPSGAALHFVAALTPLVPGPIVAGLAPGIDEAAHRAALRAGLATVAYVPGSLDEPYPDRDGALAAEIVAAGGALVAEKSDGPPTPDAFVRRDRLQAAHARAVVLVESEIAGGAMHTMRFAAALGRPRFALAPRAGSRTDGNARALGDGALPLPWDAAAAARIIVDALR